MSPAPSATQQIRVGALSTGVLVGGESRVGVGAVAVPTLLNGESRIGVGTLSVQLLMGRQAAATELAVGAYSIQVLIAPRLVRAVDGEIIYVNYPDEGWRYPLHPEFGDRSTADEPVWAVTATQ